MLRISYREHVTYFWFNAGIDSGYDLRKYDDPAEAVTH